MVQVSTSFSIDIEQLNLLNKIWKNTEFSSRSEYIRGCIVKDLEERGNKIKHSKDYDAFEDINRAMTRERLEGRVDYGYDKRDEKIELEDRLLREGKITQEQHDKRVSHINEDYSTVEKRSDEILKRREHKVKPKNRSKGEWDKIKDDIKKDKEEELHEKEKEKLAKGTKLHNWMIKHNKYCKNKCGKYPVYDDCAKGCDYIIGFDPEDFIDGEWKHKDIKVPKYLKKEYRERLEYKDQEEKEHEEKAKLMVNRKVSDKLKKRFPNIAK